MKINTFYYSIFSIIAIVFTTLYNLTLEKVEVIEYPSLISEGLISVFLYIIFIIMTKSSSMQNLVNNYLIFGFYFILIGMFNDALDEVFVHSENYTTFFEDSALLIGFMLLTFGTQKFYQSLILINDELKQKASIDHLTQLYNRIRIDESLQNEFNRYKRYKNEFGIILLDIDHFKEVNDTYGHLIGDKVLKNLALLLKNNLRNTDIIGRWGGEEFLIICSQTNQEGVEKIAQNLCEKIATATLINEKNITASFGASICKEDDSIDSLLQRVDNALYKAKNKGRNQIFIH